MRVTRGFVAKNRRKRVLKLAKGFRGAHSTQFRVAQQTTLKALSLAYRHRRLKKRTFRSLWIRRIHAILLDTKDSGLHRASYSSFIHSLKKSESLLNRKVVSQLAIFDPTAFHTLARCVSLS